MVVAEFCYGGGLWMREKVVRVVLGGCYGGGSWLWWREVVEK